MITSCPRCGKAYKIPEAMVGKRVRCKECANEFVAAEQVPSNEPPAAKPRPRPAPQPQSKKTEVAPPRSKEPEEPRERPAREAQSEPRRSGQGPFGAARHDEPAPRPSSKRAALTSDVTSMPDRIVESLVWALSPRKIGFLLVGLIAIAVLCGALLLVAVASKSKEAIAFAIVIDAVLAIGLSGVVVGGVARLALADIEGDRASVASALRFCAGRFLSLFGGSLLLVLVLVIPAAVINGGSYILTRNLRDGAFIASLFFLPHLLFNGLVLLTALAGVIVPCAIAVEECGPVKAVGRLMTVVVRHSRSLMVQYTVTLIFGTALAIVLALLCLNVVMQTLAVNSSSSASGSLWDPLSLVSGRGAASPEAQAREMERAMQQLFSAQPGMGQPGGERPVMPAQPSGEEPSPPATGDWLRIASVVVIALMVLAFPTTYWICAYTGYYDSCLPAIRAHDHQSRFD